MIKTTVLIYDIAGTAAAPSVCSWLAVRFGLGYVGFYLLLVPAVSYVASLLTDWWEDGGRLPSLHADPVGPVSY